MVTLRRDEFRDDGIFGSLTPEDDKFFFFTLEHSYNLIPKLPVGNYICKRGIHKLHDGVEFETFEIMDVPGHTGILFHAGNFNKDSDGCVLIGYALGRTLTGGKMITDSLKAHAAFMKSMEGRDEFPLTVV